MTLPSTVESVERVPEPVDGDERSILLGWLAFHRNALEAKCHGLDAQQLAGHTSLDDTCEGNRRTVRWNLTKLIGEYSRHNGHADLIREFIDGQTGE